MSAVRHNPRYVPVPGAQAPLALRIGQQEFVLEDISVGGAKIKSRGRSLPVETECQVLGLAAELSLDIIGKDDPRSVVRFGNKNQNELEKRLLALKQNRVVTDDQKKILRGRELSESDIQAFCNILSSCDGLPERAQSIVKAWIKLNQRHVPKLGSDTWSLVLQTLETTFRNYYLGAPRFELHLGDALKQIRDEGFERIHAVPMRMLQGLSKFLNQHQGEFERLEIEWRSNLWEFFNELKTRKNEGSPAHRSCLVAIDTFLSEGVSRRQFLKLMATIGPESLARHYTHIRLVAVVGHVEGQPWEEIAAPFQSAGIDVLPVVGQRLPDEGRSQTWASFLRSINRPTSDVPPSLVVFYYGAPTEAVPIYWQRSDDWHPLFRPFEYYNPSHRPIPRAPFFSAYPETLESLHSCVNQGGATLLYGQQGCGKTYLTARLAEICRSSCYIFWYQCRPFDAVENIIEHLDVFLGMFGIGDLSSSLYKPDVEAEIAGQLVNHLQQFDHPAVLILDGLENLGIVDIPDDEMVSNPLVLFVKNLIAALGRRSGSSVSKPFLLMTHTEDSLKGSTVDKVAQALGLNKGAQMMPCPADPDDRFSDVLPLARKLIRNPVALEKYESELQDLSHSDPYKTWLLCYWINRCLRRGGDDLTADICSEIEEVLDGTLVVAFGEVDNLHEVICDRLSSREHEILKTAAAWTLPWSIEDLDKILEPGGSRKRPKAAEATNRIVQDLLSDRAPFLVRLGEPLHDELQRPFAQQFGGEIRELERFEVPSIAAAFFRKRLENDASRPQIYERMAQRLRRRLEEMSNDHSLNAIERKVLEKTLRVERILALCNANKPSEAARMFTDKKEYRELRQLISWERILQLGRAILTAAERSKDSGFTSDIWCETSVVHANALTEAFRFREARDVCNRALGLAFPTTYWKCRLRLVLAKCLRFENEYEKALEQHKEVRGELEALLQQVESSSPGQNGPGKEEQEREIAVWLGRTLTVTAQCLMALGDLTEAQTALVHIRQFLPRMDDQGRRLMEGLELRHRGTIALLQGNVDEAKTSFARFASHISEQEDKRLHSIALYKQARALLEKVRIYESPMQWALGVGKKNASLYDLVTRGVPKPEDVTDWLNQAKECITKAWQGLATDRKWFPAVDICDVDAQLLELRLNAVASQADGSHAMATLQRLVERIKQRIPGRNETSARSMELGILMNSVKCQDQLMQTDNLSDEDNFQSLIDRYSYETPQDWDTKTSNPYKHSRDHYECMYYLWRIIAGYPSTEVSATQKRTLEAAAQAYRKGTTLLYRHNMVMSAHALHRLALACFADYSLGLQELLEATVCLFPDSSESVEMVLRRIAIESVEAIQGSQNDDEDRFFTIPTKIICRLLGDHDLYFEIVNKRNQPTRIAHESHSPELIEVAKKLAVRCLVWIPKKDSGYWEENVVLKKNLSPGQANQFEKWAERKVDALRAWLSEFLICTPTSK